MCWIILMKEWDPIGVNDIPEARSEYDSYIPMIYKFSILKKSEEETFDYLSMIETEFMGFADDRPNRKQKIMQVVDKLINL